MATHKFVIAVQTEGNIGDVLNSPAPKAPHTLDEVLDVLGGLAFVVECVAHLQGKEKELLPQADKARAILAALRP